VEAATFRITGAECPYQGPHRAILSNSRIVQCDIGRRFVHIVHRDRELLCRMLALRCQLTRMVNTVTWCCLKVQCTVHTKLVAIQQLAVWIIHLNECESRTCIRICCVSARSLFHGVFLIHDEFESAISVGASIDIVDCNYKLLIVC